VGKVSELECIATANKPDIIAVAETWCHSGITNAFLSISGYEVIPDLRMDRVNTGGGRGGGLIVYARCGIKVLKIDQEILHSQLISFKVSDVTFNLVYRPPSAGADSIVELTNLVKSAKGNTVFLGDFNMPSIDWNGGGGRGRERDFQEAVEECFMQQLVDFPTQVRGNILDLLITNVPERIEEMYDIGRLGKSDHMMIMAAITMDAAEEDDDSKVKDWGKADWNGMRSELGRAGWRQNMASAGAEEAWRILKRKIQDLIDKYVPVRRRRNRARPSWLSQGILRAVRKKKRLWKKAKSGEGVAEYKQAEKELRNMIRNAKRRFEKRLANGNTKNKRPFYAYVKQKTGSRTTTGPLKNGDGEMVGDSEGMAEILNKAFQEVFTRENLQDVPDPVQMEVRTTLEHVRISAKEVKKKIRGLRAEAAAGPDGIGPRILIELQDALSPALAAVFQKSLDEGVVPQDWKEANVSPIFKKGSKSAPGNYRPVSLTSVSCKVMESILKDEIMNHLEMNALLNNSQHGFMKNRSCATNLLEFLEKASTVVDSGKGFDIIYLDFAKAFDKVPRTRLLRKVKAHGIRGPILAWIEAWLTGRRQRVVLNGKFSSWEEVLSGVPQGSVLGPLLFLIFINDLDSVLEEVECLKKFADDTKLGNTVETPEDQARLQRALDALYQWSITWGMEFNVAKCKVMHAGTRNPGFEYKMAGQTLSETEAEKDIGVKVQRNLKPAAQCAEAARVAQAVLGQIARAFHYRDRHVFVQLYVQYVRPHLEFSTQAWSPWTAADKNVLERVQQRAVKMVSGLQSKVYEDRLKELGLQTLEERRHQADMVMVHKIMHGVGGLNPATWFESAASQRNTRSAADPMGIKKVYGKTELRNNFFSVRVIDDWNRVPQEMKQIAKSDVFKKNYRKLRAT